MKTLLKHFRNLYNEVLEMIIKHVKLFLMEVVYKRKLYINTCY